MNSAVPILLFVFASLFHCELIYSQSYDIVLNQTEQDTVVKKDTWFRRYHKQRVMEVKEARKERELRQKNKERQRYLSHKVHDTTRMNVLKTNPLLFISGINNISYERKILKILSVEVQAAFISFAYLRYQDDCTEPIIPYFQGERRNIPTMGFSVSIGPKVYIRKYTALSGYYFTAQYTFKYYESAIYTHYDECGGYKNIEQDFKASGFKLLFGRQIINRHNITFDIYWGAGWRFYDNYEIQHYKLWYEYVDECQCNKEEFYEDTNKWVYKDNRTQFPTIHLGVNVGYTF